MNSRKHLSWLLVLICCRVGATAHTQQSNTVVTVTGSQESNVVTRIERFDPITNRTNVITKTKIYQRGLLVQDKSERKGAVDLTGVRIYHDGQLVMLQAWDSKSKMTQRTFLRDGRAVVTEVYASSEATPDLILFHGKDEETIAALKRDDSGDLKILDAASLSEIQRGSKFGTEFMNELLDEARAKSRVK